MDQLRGGIPLSAPIGIRFTITVPTRVVWVSIARKREAIHWLNIICQCAIFSLIWRLARKSFCFGFIMYRGIIECDRARHFGMSWLGTINAGWIGCGQRAKSGMLWRAQLIRNAML